MKISFREIAKSYMHEELFIHTRQLFVLNCIQAEKILKIIIKKYEN